MKNFGDADLHHLIERFESRALPKVEWTHEAHLAVAVWYCTHHTFEEAMPLVRQYIKAHNTAVGTPNTDTEGYHESITRFWLVVTKAFLQKQTYATISQACNALIEAPEGKSDYPLQFYRKDALFSTYARHNWVEPDLRNLNSLAP
jgi:hypothetical protein